MVMLLHDCVDGVEAFPHARDSATALHADARGCVSPGKGN